MSNSSHDRIRNNPKFQQLCATRNRFALILSALMFAAYFGFVLLVAFSKETLAKPLGEGMVTTVGIPLGVGIIVFAFVLTGIYVRRANGEFDAINKQILNEVK